MNGTNEHGDTLQEWMATVFRRLQWSTHADTSVEIASERTLSYALPIPSQMTVECLKWQARTVLGLDWQHEGSKILDTSQKAGYAA
jgi:hypothetical protein